MVTFKYRNTEPGQSRHGMRDRLPRRKLVNEEGHYEQPVLAVRLDDLVSQYKLPSPTAIKLDVDGAEGHVLRGASATLRSSTLASVLIEFEEGQRAEVCGLLKSAGLTLVHEIERGKPDAPNYAEFRRDDLKRASS